ncbi:membrane protease subunit [Methylobacterium oryzae]|uniref:Membrane protease subunit n=1 Tax=Methylobacterium oryzae TaxID=334852 RepID=A0ABU7TMU6_9HYPH
MDESSTIITIITIAGLLAAAVATLFIIGPIYGVWAQRLKGRADLAQAEAETKIAVLQAEREEAAAHHYAEAEVIRAKGVARAIKEVENSLGGPEGYLRWQYVNMLEQQDGVQQIIYVPTEAGLPLLEAGKRPTAALATGGARG